MGFQYRVIRHVSVERIVAVPLAAGLCMLGAVLPGLVVIAGIAVLLVAMQTITMRRFKGGSHAHVLAEH